MPLTLGHLHLTTNLFLAPLAGYTGLPFRLLIRELGSVGLCTTDLVNARSLLEKNRKAFALVESCPADKPLAVQLYGTVPEEMRDAALLLEARNVDVVDVNMGCPVRKVVRNGGGSALLADIGRAVRLVAPMVAAVKIPVTCKMRLGWDAENLTAPDLARALADSGVAGLVVHGRTREQGFTGEVNRAGIRAVVEAVPGLPVVGNGDVTSPATAARMFAETGCAAISIGRGAFHNPWLFGHIAQERATGVTPPEPTFEERLAFMTRHLDALIAHHGEEHGCRQFRKVALAYLKPLGPVVEFRKRVVKLQTRAEFDGMVAVYRDWREHLRPSIPTPSGPNALW
jgi:nifR3 family TIM-barrel protein